MKSYRCKNKYVEPQRPRRPQSLGALLKSPLCDLVVFVIGNMLTRDIEIINKKGLHARAASKLVQLATKFKSKIQLTRDGQSSNGKSILGVLVLAAHQGSFLSLKIEGDDEVDAMQQICDLINRRFDEGE